MSTRTSQINRLTRCNTDLQQKDGSPPLHIAAVQGHAAVVAQLLLAATCQIDIRTKDGLTVLQVAQRAGQPQWPR